MSAQPLAIWTEFDPKAEGSWTPRQFSIRPSKEARADTSQIELKPLRDVVRRDTRKRRTARWAPGWLYIGVPHVIAEGLLDAASILTYQPKTPGFEAFPGDVLVSCINPRIPRIVVVPDMGVPLLCSQEFEALCPIDGLSPYALAYMLLSKISLSHMNALTAGTSASHARIKPDKLLEVVVPVPEPGSVAASRLLEVTATYEKACRSAWSALTALNECRAKEDDIFEIETIKTS
jgi:hypothetical protein